MAGPAVSEEVARAWRQRQVEIDGCQNRTRLIGLLAPQKSGAFYSKIKRPALLFCKLQGRSKIAPALLVIDSM